MKWWSLRGAHVGATLTALLAAVAAEPAAAHLDFRPRLVEQGVVADVRVELPELRPGVAPRRLELVGAGVEVISTRLVDSVGAETRWDVRLRATAEPGVVALVLRAVYADGKSVEVDQQLAILPAPQTSGFPLVGVLTGVFLAVGLAVVALRLARRKA